MLFDKIFFTFNLSGRTLTDALLQMLLASMRQNVSLLQTLDKYDSLGANIGIEFFAGYLACYNDSVEQYFKGS